MNKHILIYAGYAPSPYNGSNYQTAPGCRGSEIALVNLAEELAKNNRVTASYSPIIEGTHNYVTYVDISNLEEYVKRNPVDVLIVSRYIHYFLKFTNKAKKTFLWFHDYHAAPWLYSQQIPWSGGHIIHNLYDKIDGIVCLSDWHRQFVSQYYNLPKDKLFKIGNAININKFSNFSIFKKKRNKFIFNSANGGLRKAVSFFMDKCKDLPGAELHVFHNPEKIDSDLKGINKVIIRGFVPNDVLISEMLESEFWIYPAEVNETYCISALEARLAGCVPIVNPMGGMGEVLGNYWLDINHDRIIDMINNKYSLTNMVLMSRNEAMNITWQRRAMEWESLMQD